MYALNSAVIDIMNGQLKEGESQNIVDRIERNFISQNLKPHISSMSQ